MDLPAIGPVGRRLWLAAVLLAHALLAPVAATAQGGEAGPRPAASINADTEPFEQGMEALNRGEVDAARAHFDQALALAARHSVVPFVIASYFRDGFRDLKPDPAKAVAIFRDRAGLGDAFSQLELAVMTWHGMGVERAPEAAIQWFRQGLIGFKMLGGGPEIPEMGGLVESGPVPPELLAQFAWVRQLAETPGMGLAVATELMGRSPPDPLAACRYLALSFDRHHEAEAAYRLAMMHFGGQGIAPSRFHAFFYLDYAAILRHPAASAEIGRRLLAGEVAMRNEWDGLAWLLRARNLGIDVGDEIDRARRELPATFIKAAERDARNRPPFDVPQDGRGSKCDRFP